MHRCCMHSRSKAAADFGDSFTIKTASLNVADISGGMSSFGSICGFIAGYTNLDFTQTAIFEQL